MTVNEAVYTLSQQLQRIETKLDRLTAIVRTFASIEIEGTEVMSAQLDQLASEVERVRSVQQSAVTLIQGLAQKLQDAGTDPAQVQALADELRASADQLAAAVSANTPQDPGGGDFEPSQQSRAKGKK